MWLLPIGSLVSEQQKVMAKLLSYLPLYVRLVACYLIFIKSKWFGKFVCLLLCLLTACCEQTQKQKICQVNTKRLTQKGIDLTRNYIQKAFISLFGTSEIRMRYLRYLCGLSLSFNWLLSDGLLVFTF